MSLFHMNPIELYLYPTVLYIYCIAPHDDLGGIKNVQVNDRVEVPASQTRMQSCSVHVVPNNLSSLPVVKVASTFNVPADLVF